MLQKLFIVYWHNSHKLKLSIERKRKLTFFYSFSSQPGHRVPRFSTINWALCVPSSCSHVDVELAAKYYVNRFTNGTGVEFQIRVEDEMCQVKENKWMENISHGTKIAMWVFWGKLQTVKAFKSFYQKLSRAFIEKLWRFFIKFCILKLRRFYSFTEI